MKEIKKKLLTLISPILFLVVTLVIYAPFEIYITNQGEFWFKVSAFLWIPIILAMIVACVLLLYGIYLKEKKLNIYISVVFGVAIAIYIQANFLNLRVGVMNGADIDWSVYKNSFLINNIVWVLCVLVPVFGIKIKEMIISKVISYVSMFLTLMQVVSLLILFFTSYKSINSQQEMFISDKNLFEVSAEDNVIVFMLDMFDDKYFKELLKQEPELANDFIGFTQFTNSVGSYSTTRYSLATLFTGQFFRNEVPYQEFLNFAYDKSVMTDKLLENGWELNYYTYDAMTPTKMLEQSSNYIEGEVVISDYTEFTKKLYQLVACKYLPNIVKPYIWMDGTEFDDLKTIKNEDEEVFSPNNVIFYERLRDKGIRVNSDKKSFKFIHIEGAHYPYYINENAEEVREEETSDLKCARGVLKIVQTYMNEMKKNGVYDSSSIIIMADHGYYWDGVLTNPVLLVKPRNATGEMKVSNAPVSHIDYQPSVLSLAGLNDDMKYGKSFFDIGEREQRERLFYQYYFQEKAVEGNYRLIEYSISSENNKRESFRLTDVEYGADGEKRSHKENCEYCQSGAIDPIETEENAPLRIIHQLIE